MGTGQGRRRKKLELKIKKGTIGLPVIYSEQRKGRTGVCRVTAVTHCFSRWIKKKKYGGKLHQTLPSLVKTGVFKYCGVTQNGSQTGTRLDETVVCTA